MKRPSSTKGPWLPPDSPAHIEANDLAAVRDQIDAVAVNRRRGADAQAHVVEIEVRVVCLKAGHDQLPEELAGGLVKTHYQAAAGRAYAAILQGIVIRTDIHASVGDRRRAVGLRAQPRHPLHIFRG